MRQSGRFLGSSTLKLHTMRVLIPAPMRVLPPYLLCALFSMAAFDNVAFAQDDDAATEAPTDGAPEATVAEEEEQETRFPIRRGFYASGDFGGYFSFGGVNTNVAGIPSRTVSNFQPAIGLTLGYDLVSTDSVNLAAGLKVGINFNAGAGRLTNDERTNSQAMTYPSDYDLAQVGLAVKLGFMVLDRLAINAVVDGGLGIVSPDPSEPALDPLGGSAANPNAGETGFGVIFSAGPGIEFFTLFPGFSVGLEARFQGTIVGDDFIPGLAITAPLKYNF